MSRQRSPERPAPPFGEFLRAIDAAAQEDVDLHCIGGFAVSAYYGLERPTGDVDICNAVPHSAAAWLVAVAGLGTALHHRYGLYLQYAAVASMPYHYEERLQVLYPGAFTRLRLLIPDPLDLALSKLSRNTEIDRADVMHLAAARRSTSRHFGNGTGPNRAPTCTESCDGTTPPSISGAR